MATAEVENGLNLGDVPDLSGFGEAEYQPFVDGWYQGTILETRTSTDKVGNERTFASSDDVSSRGDSRNIRLQVALKRQSDGRGLNISYLLNYRPDDLTTETVQRVAAQQAKQKAGEEEGWGDLFRSFMTLNRLSKLQSVAGVRQFSRTEAGGLNIAPLFGKTAYFRIGPDTRNSNFKQVVDVRVTAPKVVI